MGVGTIGQSQAGSEVCTAYNEKGCLFGYEVHQDQVRIHVLRRGGVKPDKEESKAVKEACAQVNTLGITLGVFGAVLLLGILAILAFKVYQYLQYRREYEKFNTWIEDQAKFATNQMPNDLYIKPITTTINPMHRQRINED